MVSYHRTPIAGAFPELHLTFVLRSGAPRRKKQVCLPGSKVLAWFHAHTSALTSKRSLQLMKHLIAPSLERYPRAGLDRIRLDVVSWPSRRTSHACVSDSISTIFSKIGSVMSGAAASDHPLRGADSTAVHG
jgi:hypothetical protein